MPRDSAKMIESAYCSIAEVAARMQLSEPRIYALIAEGAIPALRVGRRIRIPRASFERWLNEQVELALANVKREAVAT